MADPIERKRIEDPNARSILEAGQVQGGGIMSPKRADMSQVGKGQQELAEMLTMAGGALQKYADKKNDEARTDGMMQRAAGVAEEEVRKSGNRHTVDGYLAMKARTEANVWFQSALSDIEDGDKAMSSEDYQKKLSAGFKQINDSVGDNPYVKDMLGAMVEQQFPTLVAQQVKSNNAYLEKETASTYSGLMVSELERFDPENPEDVKAVQELKDPKVTGLPIEQHNDALVDAMTMALDSDSKTAGPKFMAVIGATAHKEMEEIGQQSGVLPNLTGAILSAESNGKRYGKDGKVLEGPVTKDGSTAKGEMQVMDYTNKDPGFGVKPAADGSLAERARVGKDYLAAMYNRYNKGNALTGGIMAAMAYNAGPGNLDDHIAKVGDPNSAGGPSLSAFVKSFPFKETRDYATKVAGDISGNQKGLLAKKESVFESLRSQGFNFEQTGKLMKAYEGYMKRQSDAFDKDKILAEQTLIDDVTLNGNLPGALDKIQKMKDEKGYDDGWANGMASKVISANDAYKKEAEQGAIISSAVSTNSLGTLTPAQQEKGIKAEKLRISQEVSVDDSIPQEEKSAKASEKIVDMLVANNVVDKTIANTIDSKLTGNIVGKDGKITQEALSAYQTYQAIKSKSNAGYAAKYLGASKDLVNIADAYYGMDPTTALTTANDIMTQRRENPNWKPPTPNPAEVQAAINQRIDQFDSTVFSRFNRLATDSSDVLDREITAAKSDPRLKTFMEDQVRLQLNRGLPMEAAINAATQEAQQRIEFTAGNVLIAGKTTSIKQDMGIQRVQEPTAVNKAFMDYMRKVGPTLFGASWDDAKTQLLGNNPKETNWFGGHGQLDGSMDAIEGSIQSNRRDIPNLFVRYDPDQKGFLVDVYTNQERTSLLNAQVFIPAKEVGDYANRTVFKQQSIFENLPDVLPSVKEMQTDEWIAKYAMQVI